MLKAICLGRVSYEINLLVDKVPEEGSTSEFFEKKGGLGGTAGIIGYLLTY